jgi:hypothetical protein
VFRFSPGWLSAAAIALATVPLATGLSAAPARAQAQPAAGRPASLELMGDLALAAAVTVCELAVEDKVPVQKSVIANAKAVTFLVTNRYGSQVVGAGKLEAEQIANGTIIQVVARVKQGCYDRLGAADKKFVDDVMSEVQKAAQPQPQAQPRR